MTPWRRTGFSRSSSGSASTDGQSDHHWRSRGGCGPEGHQERPPERVPTGGPGPDIGSKAYESGHDPAVRDLKVALDTAAAAKAQRAGTGVRPRISAEGKPLRVGKAAPVEDRGSLEQTGVRCSPAECVGADGAPPIHNGPEGSVIGRMVPPLPTGGHRCWLAL